MSRPTALAATATAAIAVAVAVALPVSGQAQSAGEQTIELTARTTGVRIVDLAPRGRVSAGDVLVSTNRLTNAAGAPAGTAHMLCGVTRPARTFERATFQCAGTQRLNDGTLSFSLVARLGADRVITAAITGGTGAYAGARGSVVNTERSENVSDQVVRLLP